MIVPTFVLYTVFKVYTSNFRDGRFVIMVWLEVIKTFLQCNRPHGLLETMVEISTEVTSYNVG